MLSISSLKDQLSGKIQIQKMESDSPALNLPNASSSTQPVSPTSLTSSTLNISSFGEQISEKMELHHPELDSATTAPLPIATSALLDLAIASMEASVSSYKISGSFPGPTHGYDTGCSDFSGTNLQLSTQCNEQATLPLIPGENQPIISLFPADSKDAQLVSLEQASLVLDTQPTASVSESIEFPLLQDVENVFEHPSTVPVINENTASIVVMDSPEPVSVSPKKENGGSAFSSSVSDLNAGSMVIPPENVDKSMYKAVDNTTDFQGIDSLNYIQEAKSAVDPVENHTSITCKHDLEMAAELVEKTSCSPVDKCSSSSESKSPVEVQGCISPAEDCASPKAISASPEITSCRTSVASSELFDVQSASKCLHSPRKPHTRTKLYPIRSSSKACSPPKVTIPKAGTLTKSSPKTSPNAMPVPLTTKVNPLIMLCKEQLSEKLSHTSKIGDSLVTLRGEVHINNADLSPDSRTENTSGTTVCTSHNSISINSTTDSSVSNNALLTLDGHPIKMELQESDDEIITSHIEDNTAPSSSIDAAVCSDDGPTNEVMSSATASPSSSDSALENAIRVLADWSSAPAVEQPEVNVEMKVEAENQKLDWACAECGKEFGKHLHLQLHMKDHEASRPNVAKPHSCARCRRSFKYSIALKKHKCNTNTSEQASGVNSSAAAIANALKWPYFCEMCCCGFLKKLEFLQHQLSHPLDANQENKPSVAISNTSEIHSKSERIINTESTETFADAMKWPYFCETCCCGFLTKLEYFQHQLSHPAELNQEDKPFTCTICEKHFKHKGALHTHMSLHSGQDCYMCRFCFRMFARKSTWQEHERCHSGEIPLTCQFCGKHFRQKSSLHYHELNHMGVTRHSCPYCSKTFVQARSLRAHVQAHKGLKPFNCDICKKGFLQKGSLKYHLLQHDYYNRHKCIKCRKLFPKPEDLKVHFLSAHGLSEDDCNDFADIEASSTADINLGVSITELKQRVRTLMSSNIKRESAGVSSLDVPKQEAAQMISNLRKKVRGIMAEDHEVPIKILKK